MTDDGTGMRGPATVGRALRTPRAAAVAGIVPSVQFAATVVLIRSAVPADPAARRRRRGGGPFASVEGDAGTLFTSGAWDLGRHLSHDLLVVYAMRMAAVFTIATSTILLRTASAPRWLAAGGYRSRPSRSWPSAPCPGSSCSSPRGCWP